MSNLKTKRVQIGDHSTATNNFVMHQSDTPDGKVHISNGTLDSHTSKVTLAHDGKLGVGTTSPTSGLDIQTDTNPVMKVSRRTNNSANINLYYNTTFRGQVSGAAGSFQLSSVGSSTPMQFYTDGSKNMEIDTSGAVTKPNQPAFLVTKSGDQSNLSTGYNAITWQNETYDVGSNFASNTFTAPVTGKYLLRASLSLKDQPSNASWYILRVDTSNRIYMNSQSTGHWNGNASSFLKTLASTVVVDMDVNDTASIMYYQYQGTTQADVVANADYTFFSGILLS